MIDTKANTLINIKCKLQKFKIPKSYVFTVKDWNKNKKIVLTKIKEIFKKDKKIIIRSSSKFEDNLESSAAGKYESILNINPHNIKNLKFSIKKVIDSYKKYNKKITNDQVLVQEMISNIKMSGVIFTGNNLNNDSYYSINYDDVTGLTDTITSGSSMYSNKTLYIFKDRIDLIVSDRFKKIINATQELERFFLNISLDIEFGLTKQNELFLFQVRPVIKNKQFFKIDNIVFRQKLNQIYKKLQKYFSSNQKDINGKNNLFSQMSDWNPAEMIGQYPSDLSYSLYDKLITKSSWLKARKIMGYNYFKDSSLMYKFGGSPYIDIRKSINSFLPKSLSKKIIKDLVDFSIRKLRKNPKFHDKIEFELAPTCFSFDIDQKIFSIMGKHKGKLILNNLKSKFLKMFLKNIIKNSKGSIEYNLKKIEVLKNLQNTKKYKVDGNLSNLNLVINQTIKYGIIPFSILARHGFIAKTNLLSLVKSEVINNSELGRFEKSILTITSEFLNDQNNLNNLNNYKTFIKKYGHLRAGTYDIKSKCYSELNKNTFLQNKEIKLNNKKFKFSKKQLNKIDILLKKNNIHISHDELIEYFKKSIRSREYAKFIFTKSVSIILENIKIFAKKNKININDIEQLNIQDILKFKKDNFKNLLKKIEINKEINKHNRFVNLPEIVVSPSNAFIGASVVSVPNFVSNEIVDGSILHLNNKVNNFNIDNKIVLIENADPGYDWIFGYKIKGLITKFGGANSHMTIRCNELNIPAAIGCGESMFKNLLKTNKLSLNCKNKVIRSSQNI
tara:strand:+ start:4512 stop:6869 length:2358 start_codon:yes stop_codon:yes gene_type:complete